MNLTERIESVILSNLQSPEDRKIGVECECFFYDKERYRIPVNSGGNYSATDLLNEMVVLQSDDKMKAGYSVEPGGQLEWASPPLTSLHEINKHFKKHKIRVSEIVKRESLKYINYSLEPLYSPTEIDLIRQKKYQLMDKMFAETGKLGPWMMRNTASIQINIDFSSRKEAEKMAYIADCLTPIASILFANSPFWKRRRAGIENLRYKIWDDTDNSRCGSLVNHGIINSENLIQKYAQYIQFVPAIFIEDKNGDIVQYEDTLGVWLKELLNQGKLTDEQIQIALHQIFTHVRFKNVLEIRGADKPPPGHEFAPADFWVGLLLDNETQDKVFNIVNKWSLEDRQKLTKSAYRLDLTQIGPENNTIGDWISKICRLSIEGLNKRSKKYSIKNENIFLRNYLDLFNKKGIIALQIQNEMEKSGKTLKKFI